MNTIQLKKLLSKDPLIKTFYKGVFACDKLPKILQPLSIHVLNTDISSEPGAHWILISTFESPNSTDYICSLGTKPYHDNVIKSMLSCGKIIYYNNIPLQSSFTTTCSFHVLFFAYMLSCDIPFSEII